MHREDTGRCNGLPLQASVGTGRCLFYNKLNRMAKQNRQRQNRPRKGLLDI